MKIIKKYYFLIFMLLLMGLLFVFSREAGLKAVDTTMYSLREMVSIIPPIFILMGLLDVWVPRETMIKLMGEKSGVVGIVLSIILGTAAAGPLYAAFPIAAVFMRKGIKFTNLMIFVGAWSTTKIPMLLFEAASMGAMFTLTRLCMSIIGIFGITFIIGRMVNGKEIEVIYTNAAKQ